MKKYLGRRTKLNRFNVNYKNRAFYELFQNVMIERLNLNYNNEYHIDNVNDILKEYNKTPKSINTSIKDNFLVTCKIEPELYIEIQDIYKKMINRYIPMNEFIYSLITNFVMNYKKLPKTKNVPIFKRINPERSKNNLRKFHKRFKKYYNVRSKEVK